MSTRQALRKFALVLTAAGMMTAAAAAQDALVANPRDYKLELENEYVRVLRLRQEAHARLPEHEQPAAVIVYLTAARQKFNMIGGKSRLFTKKAGEVAYLEGGKRTEENSSNEPLEAVVVELKPNAPKSDGHRVTLDPTKLDPENVKVVFENAQVRVLHTTLAPHRADPEHEHLHYVVVYLTPLHTTMKISDGRVLDNVRRAGEVGWREAMKHATENVDDKPASEIQIELK